MVHITRFKDWKCLLGLELGDQIAFLMRLNRTLKFEGYYKLDRNHFSENLNNSTKYKKEWFFYDKNDNQAYDE